MSPKQFLCIGHRGAMGHAPENTLSSFRKALELGVPCVELDVHNVDGNLVVFHDDRLERTTDGAGYLAAHSFKQLRALDAGSGEKIPTLTEVFELIDKRAGVNIELKGSDTAHPVAKFIAGLRQQGWHDNLILVSSFNHRELETLKQLDPTIKLGALFVGLPVDDAEFAVRLGAYSVNTSLEFVDKRFVKNAHSNGLRVFVFTVNHPEDITRMRELGVDGVFTNFPERVLQDQEDESQMIGWY
jgi:glycerophosphoryl diester phosphodiesterase